MATSAMIQVLTDKVFTALLNQVKFALDFKDQLESMKTKLELMEVFISYTDKHKTRGEMFEKFLPTLRKLIYEADDILTDCQIRDEYRKEGFCDTFSPSHLFFLYKTGKELSHINSQIEKIESSLGVYMRPQQSVFPRPNNSYQTIRYSSQDYEPSEIIGLENDMEKIKGWILNGSEILQRIGIVGMGGLGKTTVAQKIFNDREIVACFENMIWVPVSQNLNEERIMRIMLKQLGEDESRIDDSLLLRKIHQLLSDKTCLIVMDDVWTMNQDWWDKLCPTGKGCFAIITSRNEEVIKKMGVDKSRIHRPRVLNEEESWALFCKHAFSVTRGKCPNKEFERIGKEILKKCGGLPLAIKTIGALLAPKVHSLGEWVKVNDDFHELTTEGENSSVVASLQLSYDELPTHLKQCLLCFSIYPDDFEISGEQIVHWWIGEGLIHGRDTRTAMELGFDYLSELVSRCLVEVMNRRGYDGRVYSCKMHDLVRDMTIKIAKDEAFCSFDEQGRQKLTEDSRWLGFTIDMGPKLLKRNSKLRALLLMASIPVSFDRNLEFLSSLRVLDFSHSKLDTIRADELLKFICSLKRLAYLNLSGDSSLKEVPHSIKRLQNLQIFILRKCNNLGKVHPSMTCLKRLIILDLGSCPLRYLPQGIGKLIHLQELSGFRVVSQANTQSCRLLELQNLTQLRVLRMNINTESEISENEWNVLTQLEKLKVLAVDAEDCKEKHVSEMLDQMLPPRRLQELYVKRYRFETLPKWIHPGQLKSLQYLCLEDGDISHFQLSSKYEDGDGSSWILEGLCLKFMPNLALDWNVLVQDMHLLHYAEVSRCFNLKNFPYPTDKPVIWRRNQD